MRIGPRRSAGRQHHDTVDAVETARADARTMTASTAVTDASVTELAIGECVRRITQTRQSGQWAQMTCITLKRGGNVVLAQSQLAFRHDAPLELAACDV